MLDTIGHFAERDVLDELGIGGIRDALAEIMFPGTSTIQTRARYFLFIPWIYQELERKRAPSAHITQRARAAEMQLTEQLKKAHDHRGAFGAEAGQTLRRLASNVYWGGLRRWGILLFPGSQDAYHRSLDRYYEITREDRSSVRTDDREPVEGYVVANWHPNLPPPPPGFPGGATFALTHDEARYLQQRLMTTAPDTFLTCLTLAAPRANDVSFPWQHPLVPRLPPSLQRLIRHARNFSEVMYGAALIYNLMLSEQVSESRIEDYQKRWTHWVEGLVERADTVEEWDPKSLWQCLAEHGEQIRQSTKQFVETWWALVRPTVLSHHGVDQLREQIEVRRLIAGRERQTKGSQARLDNPRAAERWTGASGVGQLSYRWPVVQTLVRDIVDGLERVDA